jgi:AcrR family transcriptional regulator
VVKRKRPELPKDFVAGHKRRRMMEAIAGLTARMGYDATKIADIVRGARVARKTLYDNFDGKEDLFLAALDFYLAEVRERVEAACEASPGPWQRQVEAGLEAFLGFVAERPAAARMCMVEAISATPSSASRYDAAVAGFVEQLRRRVPEREGLPGTLEETLVGGVAWIVNQQIRRGEAEGAGDLFGELSDFLLSPYHGVAGVTVEPGDETDSTVADLNA